MNAVEGGREGGGGGRPCLNISIICRDQAKKHEREIYVFFNRRSGCSALSVWPLGGAFRPAENASSGNKKNG